MKFMPSGISEVCTIGASVEIRREREENASVGRCLGAAVFSLPSLADFITQ